MKKLILPVVFFAAATLYAGDHAAPSPAGDGPTSAEALAALKAGNQRYAAGETTHPHADQDRRCETYAGGQHPIATVLSCADSRVPPEILFDSGIGDLFVIRVAGNVADVDEIATIEYGAGHLKTPLIVVMGHAKCGAVTAAVDGAKVHGHLPGLLKKIKPAAEDARDANPELKGAPLVAKAIRANVFQAMQDVITRSDDVAELLKTKQVKLVGAMYDLHTGQVQWLGEHPRQAELLSDRKPAAADEHADAHKDEPHDEPAAPPVVPAKKPAAAKKDPHAKPTKAAASHDEHDAHSQAKPAAVDTVAKSPLQQYGPIGALAIGAMSLALVTLNAVRR